MKKLFFFALLVIASPRLSAQIDLNKGLMMYLPFKGNTLDASPNANNATNFGATLTADQWGNPNSAYRFNGTSSYMRIANAASLQCDTQITLCARVNVNGFYDGLCKANSIISKEDLDQTPGYYSLRFIASNNTAGSCTFQDTNNQNFYGSFYGYAPSTTTFNNPPYIVKNKWYCLVYIFDGTNIKMFVDGTLRYSMVASTKIGKNMIDVFLGKTSNPDYPYWFNGIMDEVRIYNRALNVMEIDSICSQTNPQQTSIKETEGISQLPIIANPVVTNLELGLEQKDLGGSLSIIDMAGRTLINIEHLNEPKVFVGHLASGIYMVNYQLGDKYMSVKLIKH